MKKEIKVVFIIDGKRSENITDEVSERLRNDFEQAFAEYFGNNPSEWLTVTEKFVKENEM